MVYGGGEADVFAAAEGVEVEPGVAAGVAVVAGAEPLFAADAPAPDVAFSALAATAADLADGAAAVPFDVAAGDGALAVVLTAGMAVADALDVIEHHARLALPSAQAN